MAASVWSWKTAATQREKSWSGQWWRNTPGVAADDLVFEFGEVGGDRSGERVSVGSEIEPAAALDADMPFAR
ncbi:MAG: hypothetical protein ACXVGR_16140 [Mycobacteriaceae bacterium]